MRLPKIRIAGIVRQSQKKLILALITALFFGVIGTYFLIQSFAVTSVTSVKSGNWSDPSVWNSGRIPTVGDAVVIAPNHNVIMDSTTATVDALSVNTSGTLEFTPSKSATLETSGNVIVNGTLRMRPASASVNHLLRFIKVNEEIFQGGGMDPLTSDVGLWVMGAGKLDIAGTERSGWLNAAGSITQGASSFTLAADPVGWQVGDEISISPTEYGHATQFDLRKISAISGRTVTLSSGTSFAHPAVTVSPNKIMTAEVMNLTRNANIEGTKPTYRYPRDGKLNTTGGRAHIFIRNTTPVVQTVNHAGIRYMGPRKNNSTSANSLFVLGRYGIHFHMSGENNRGTVVEGTVVRDTDSHAFVPHLSNGITFRDTVSYDTSETAYWWDVKGNEETFLNNDPTHEITYDRTMAALANVDYRGDTRLAGYSFTPGMGNVMKNTVAVGILGRVQASGYLWPEGANGAFNTWRFDTNNVSHNNLLKGLFSWQNDDDHHIIRDFITYHNGAEGIDHGAYSNRFKYADIISFRNNTSNVNSAEVVAHSKSVESTTWFPGELQQFREITIDTKANYALSIPRHRLAAEGFPVQLSNWNVKSYASKAVVVNEMTENSTNRSDFDFVCWTLPGGRDLEPSDFHIISMVSGSTFRVQRKNGTAYQLKADGTSQVINRFASCPAPLPIASEGSGLTARYFNNSDLTALVGTRKEGPIGFTWPEGGTSPYPGVDPNTYSATWTGQVQPLYTEDYTFQTRSMRGVRLYVNGQKLIDNWASHHTAVNNASPITLTAGQKYDIKLEYHNDTTSSFRGIIDLNWSSPSTPIQPVSEFQLFPETTSTPTTDTQPPSTAITTPTNSQTLSGTIPITASATDNVAVTKVDFLIDGQVVGSDTTAPYTYSWNTTTTTNASHTIQSKAYDAAGNSGQSSVVSVTVNNAAVDNQSPTAPSNLTAQATSVTQVSLNWTASTDNVGVKGYYVRRGSTIIASVTSTSYTDSNVLPSTNYSYSIVAYDAANNSSPASNTATVTTPAAPDTQAPTSPSNLTATAASTSQINLRWTASTDNVGVARYEVYRGSTKIGDTTGTSFGDTGLTASTSYSYSVKAVDAAGNQSSASNTATATTLTPTTDTTPPTAPSNLTATGGRGRITLNWNAATDNIGVTGYYLYRDGIRYTTTTATSYEDKNTRPKATYRYYVRAFDAAGNIGPTSNTVNGSQ